jgi:hypothetical protein
MASNTTNPSICIPRVFPNIDWKRVKNVFEELGMGEVERVDMVNKVNDKGEKFKRVFVHFKKWNDDPTTRQVKSKLLSGDSVKVVYDDPWFWKIFISHVPKPQFEKKKTTPRPAKKAFIDSQTDDVKQMQALLKSQKEALDAMRAEIAQLKTSHTSRPVTPPYGIDSPPHSPVYTPDTSSEFPSPPKLVRQVQSGTFIHTNKIRPEDLTLDEI